MCQLLPTFQDLGNLTLEALFLLLQGHHSQLQSKPEAVSEGGGLPADLPAPIPTPGLLHLLPLTDLSAQQIREPLHSLSEEQGPLSASPTARLLL